MLLATAVPSFGQRGGIKVEVRPDALVTLDENFQVVFTIEGAGRILHFEWEPGDDFRLIWGPARSTSSSTTIVNGKRTINNTQSYTYTLRANRTGTLPIPTASATVDGTPVTSEIGSVTVIPGENAAAEPQTEAAGDDNGGATMQGITIATYTAYRKKKGLKGYINALRSPEQKQRINIWKNMTPIWYCGLSEDGHRPAQKISQGVKLCAAAEPLSI